MARAVWLAIRGGRRVGMTATRRAAQRIFEKPYWPGNATVRNPKTGETWERRAGSWFRTVEPQRKVAS